MKYPMVYIITLSFNRKEDTIECIESLKRITYPNFVIIVVENGSTDGSKQAIKSRFPDIKLIEIKKNIGYSRGFNTGLEFANKDGADYCLIINNDTVIDPEALTELVKTAESDEKIGFVSGKVYYYNDPLKLQTVGKKSHPFYLVGENVGFGEYDRGQYDKLIEYDFIDDVFLLVKRDVYENVGGYDKNFFLHWEETDWCARVRRAGYKIIYSPRAKIWHKGLLTTSDGMTPTALYYLTRNQFLFILRNANPTQIKKTLIHLFIHVHPITIARFLKHGKYSYVNAYLRGILSGLYWLITKK